MWLILTSEGGVFKLWHLKAFQIETDLSGVLYCLLNYRCYSLFIWKQNFVMKQTSNTQSCWSWCSKQILTWVSMYLLSSGFSRPLQPSWICGMLHIQAVHSVLEINNYLVIMADEMISYTSCFFKKEWTAHLAHFSYCKISIRSIALYLGVFQIETWRISQWPLYSRKVRLKWKL